MRRRYSEFGQVVLRSVQGLGDPFTRTAAT